MFQGREPGINPLLMAELLRFESGNSNILNQSDKTKILNCYMLLPKMFSGNNFFEICLLTNHPKWTYKNVCTEFSKWETIK